MDKSWKENQLILLNRGESIFRYIPNEIGNIQYCDTSEPREEPYTKEQINKRRLTSVLLAILVLAIIWFPFYDRYLLCSIVSAIVLFITYKSCKISFDGIDYFVGEKGFATINFSQNRDNITEKKIILFDEMEYFFHEEIGNYASALLGAIKDYRGTDYRFSIYAPLKDNSFEVLYSITGSYNDEKPQDNCNPNGASIEYPFCKKINENWSKAFIYRHKGDKEFIFALKDEDTIYSDAIVISPEGINIMGTEYNPQNTKSIAVKNGSLVLEHENHKSKLFGFIQKGDQHSIPLSKLGNKDAFLLFFDTLYKNW